MDVAAMESIAVDLSSPRSISRAKSRRGRKHAIERHVQQRINVEINRAEQRINWLERKIARLPLTSNARRKAAAEAGVLHLMLNDLRNPPRQRDKGTSYIHLGFKHAQRAAALLNEIVREDNHEPKPVRKSPMVGETSERPREPRTWHGPRLGRASARKRARCAATNARKANR
ncbi:MAG: hypothetical protein KGL39_51515 [Patescibacteria group bacterium]|nr:hypothetical protein [Patescibacteria group bacterium]